MFIMKKSFAIKCVAFLLFMFQACTVKQPQPPNMISVPQFEFISKSTINDSTRNIKVSLDAFYISNEITNKEYREFTDWAKEHPDETLVKTKEIIIKKNPEPGKTRVWTVPVLITMRELLPKLIDSNAMYKVDRRIKNYFTDEKYNDYPVVGVSKNAAEFYCNWLLNLETKVIVLHKGQTAPNGMRVKEKSIMAISPSYGYYRIPLEIEWDYVAKQPYERELANDHMLHKVNEGNPDRWGILHLHDNVSEWATDPNDSLALCKGDNWKTEDKSLNLLRMNVDSSRGYIGFRIVRTYKPEEINIKQKK
jgi:formylglycine-generating enzyme required for sulfatase activity